MLHILVEVQDIPNAALSSTSLHSAPATEAGQCHIIAVTCNARKLNVCLVRFHPSFLTHLRIY
jgi:hypothetical protein